MVCLSHSLFLSWFVCLILCPVCFTCMKHDLFSSGVSGEVKDSTVVGGLCIQI